MDIGLVVISVSTILHLSLGTIGPLLTSLYQYSACTALKAVKTKEESLNVIDKAAKYMGYSIDHYEYHAWYVDENSDVCDDSKATLMKFVEHPSLELIL
jgi:hypothetical protein